MAAKRLLMKVKRNTYSNSSAMRQIARSTERISCFQLFTAICLQMFKQTPPIVKLLRLLLLLPVVDNIGVDYHKYNL